MKDAKKFFLGLALFAGTIIGVGIFGLPYIASKVGFIPTVAYFLVLGGIVFVIQKVYANIIVNTPGDHRYPGYAEYWLGPKWKKAMFTSNVIGFSGSLLAYLIVGGTFLSSLMSSSRFEISEVGGVLIFFSIGSLLILWGRKSIASVELWFLVLFILIVIGLTYIGWNKIQFVNLTTFNSANIFLPFGVVMFSFWGTAVIPEVRDIVGGSKKILMKVLPAGALVSLIVYTLFVFVTLGISGESTSQEAVVGLKESLGGNIIIIGYLFGFITTFTSFLTLGLTIKNIYHFDFKIPLVYSWVLACFIPLGLYFIGLTNFIDVIMFIGAVLLGFEGIVLLKMYQKVRRKINPKLTKVPWWMYLVGTVFIIGVSGEIFYFIKNYIA